MSRIFCVFVLAVFLSGLSGCGLMQTAQKMTRESMKSMRPNSNDYRDTTKMADDEWSVVGDSARTVRPLEKENDPVRDIIQSPKARSIERSLGLD